MPTALTDTAPQILVDVQGAFILSTFLATWVTVWSPQYWKLLKKLFILFSPRSNPPRLNSPMTGIADVGEDHTNNPPCQNTEERATSSVFYKILEGFGVVFDNRTAEEGLFYVFEEYGVLSAVKIWFRDNFIPHSGKEGAHAREECLRNWEEELCAMEEGLRTTGDGLPPIEESSIESPRNSSVWHKLVVLVLLAFCAAIFIGITAASISTGLLIQDNSAIPARQRCRMWENPGENIMSNPRGDMMEFAEAYYRTCYENDPSVQECDQFIDNDLHDANTTFVECPFKGDVCLLGKNSAIRWDTGLLDSIILGINSRYRPSIQKETICSPLIIEGYYDFVSNTSTNSTTFNFHYGNNSTNNITYSQNRSDYFENLYSPSGYEIKTKSATSGQFQPIDAFTSNLGYTFIAFVNTFNLEYPSPSHDPIFPANTSSPCTTGDQTCWKDSVQPARVLGCTESAKVCSPSMDHCYDVWDPSTYQELSSATWAGAEEALLVWFALSYSDFGNTLATRHGFLLEATRRIIGNRLSEALDPNQWELEVRRLFEMSLIRAKYEMLYIVRGTTVNQPGYTDILPPQFGDVCDKFAFQVKGFQNMTLLGILIVFCLPIFLGLEIRKEPTVVWSIIGAWRLAMLGWSTCHSVMHTILATFSQLRLKFMGIFQRRTDKATGQTAAGPPCVVAHNAVAPRSSMTRSESPISDNPVEPAGIVLEMKDMTSTRIDELL